jgi:hypothetical protein
MLAIKDGDKNSWRDGCCALLDSHCKQLRHHPSLGLTRVSVVPREGNKPIRDDQVQSCNQGKRVTAFPYYLPTYASPLVQPIPLECLRLASFNDEPEVREQHLGLFKRVGSGFRSSPTKERMHPFTIYHAAAKMTRRYTLYTKSKTERNEWNVALEAAIEARKSQQDAEMVPLSYF